MDKKIERISTIADNFIDMDKVKSEEVPDVFIGGIRRLVIQKRLTQAKDTKGRDLTENETENLTSAFKKSSLSDLLRQSSINRGEIFGLLCQIIAAKMPEKTEGQEDKEHEDNVEKYFNTLESASSEKGLKSLSEAIKEIEEERTKAITELAKSSRKKAKELKR